MEFLEVCVNTQRPLAVAAHHVCASLLSCIACNTFLYFYLPNVSQLLVATRLQVPLTLGLCLARKSDLNLFFYLAADCELPNENKLER